MLSIRKSAFLIFASFTISTAALAQEQTSVRSDLRGSVEIDVLAQRVARSIGKTILLDPSVRGKIVIAANKTMSDEEYFQAFAIALQINGFSYVEKNGFIVVMPGRTAQRDAIPFVDDPFTVKEERMIIWVRQLKHATGDNVNKYLRTLTSKDGTMEIYEPTNTVVLTDYTSTVRRMSVLVDRLDVPATKK